jgi:hypothetical protein
MFFSVWKLLLSDQHGVSIHKSDLSFYSIGDLERGASCLYAHLLKHGLAMQIGTGATPSKTVVMYFLFTTPTGANKLNRITGVEN